MRKTLTLLLLLCGLGLAGCGDSNLEVVQVNSPGPAWSPPNPSALSPRLQAVVDRALADNRVPGALVGVYTPNGTWTTATGFADVETRRPISLADASAWRSITKSLTVTIVLQLVAEGRLSLDAPVGTYVNGVPNGGNITLRQLAEMRSGLFNYTADEGFRQRFAADLTAPWTDQEILAAAFSHPVNFPAGSQYEYSNTNTILLGVVAETVTGQPLKQLIENRILSVLGLNQSQYMTGITLPAPSTKGYFFDDDDASFVPLVSNATSLSGAGAMAGTLEDLRKWGAALVGGTLLPADLQRQRFQSGPATNGPFYNSYGLGMGEIRGWWGHTGNGLGYQAAVMTEPTTGSQIVVMVNATNANDDVPADIVSDIQDVLGWPVPEVPR